MTGFTENQPVYTNRPLTTAERVLIHFMEQYFAVGQCDKAWMILLEYLLLNPEFAEMTRKFREPEEILPLAISDH